MAAEDPQRFPEPSIQRLSSQSQAIMDRILSSLLATQCAQLLTIRKTRRRRWCGRRCCRQRWRYRSRSMSMSTRSGSTGWSWSWSRCRRRRRSRGGTSSSGRLHALATTRLCLDSCCCSRPVHVVFCCTTSAGAGWWVLRRRRGRNRAASTPFPVVRAWGAMSWTSTGVWSCERWGFLSTGTRVRDVTPGTTSRNILPWSCCC